MKLISSGQIIDINNNLNFDLYTFESKSAIATKETNIQIDYQTGVVTGDQIAYGDWFDLNGEDIDAYIDYLLQNKSLLRELPSQKLERTSEYER